MTSAQLPPAATPAPQPPTVVVVNDDATQRQMLAGLLRKDGHAVQTFESAETALKYMQPAGAPELIVTDIYMPGLDGWRFCRLLRSPEYARFNAVPILVVSATYAGEETARLTHELGANAFLPMPVDGPQFLETVRALLRGEKSQAALKVLIVEASRLSSIKLVKAFQAHGYLAEPAFTYQAGLTLIGQTAFDIAVLDYHLPDGQGDTLLKVLQEQSPDCVCVMMTADPQPELALTWMKMGAAAYLQKPFEPDYLIAQCERARREHALLRVQDLLERRTRELRESEAKYRLIADTMADTISVIDLRMLRFTYVSPSIVRLRGFTVEEALGQTLEQIMPPASLQLALQTLDEELRLEASGRANPDRSRVLELEEYRKEGTTLWVSNTTSFLRDEQRQPVALLVLSRDITERRQAQHALQTSDERFRQAMKATQDGLWDWNIITGEVYYSPNYWHMLGYEAREFENQPCAWADLIHPDDRERTLAVNQACIENHRQTFEVEFRMKAHTGGWKWILGRGQAAGRDAQGRALRMVGTHTDVTERKQAEEALRASEAQYRLSESELRAAQAVARIGNWKWNLPKGEITWSDEMYRIFGIDKTSYTGRLGDVIAQVVHPDDLHLVLPANARGFVEDKPIEYRIIWPDKSIRYIWAKAGETVLDDAGNPICLTGIAQDITERKQAEEALRASEKKYRVLFEVFPLGITVANKDGKISESNREAERLLHISKEEQERRSIDGNEWQIIRPDGLIMPTEEYASVRALKENRLIENIEMGIPKGREGSVIWINVTAAPLGDSEVVIAYQDITARKQAEEALRQSEERYQLIDEASQDLIYSYDRQSRFTHANSNMCRRLGLKLEQIIGKTHAALGFPQEQCTEWARLHQQVYQTNQTVMAETITPIQGGSPQYFEVVLNPMHDETGAIIGIAGTTRDIHARKLTEAQINEQLEELRRWHEVTLGREERILELKGEVNQLLAEAGKPGRYASAQEAAHA